VLLSSFRGPESVNVPHFINEDAGVAIPAFRRQGDGVAPGLGRGAEVAV